MWEGGAYFNVDTQRGGAYYRKYGTSRIGAALLLLHFF